MKRLPEHESVPLDELAAAARSGDPRATDAWYRAEWSTVYRLCLGLLADPASAEDAAQDAMLHLLDRLSRWDPERPYAPWRNAVVVRAGRDRSRRADARRRAEDASVEVRGEGPLPDPAEEASRGEVQELLRESLRSLSPREREAFVLRDLEGLATSETADAMGVTDATVRSLLTLARRRLRNLLGPRLAAAGAGEGGLDP